MTPQNDPPIVHETEPLAAPLPLPPEPAEPVSAEPVPTEPVPTEPPPTAAAPAALAGDGQWQRLPPRARRVFVYVSLLVAVPPTLIASLVLYRRVVAYPWGLWAIGGLWLLAVGFALWIAYKRYQYTFWKLDQDGFAVRRGRLWQWETRVPTSRVQHLDIKRGPLERPHRLASLVLHTAGTRLSAVSISGLDDADAERLRDHFSHQIDRQDDDDDAGA